MKISQFIGGLKSLILGRARNISDEKIFHKVSLVAILAWVGLGADGLSSSCYGPEETFKALGSYTSLSVIIALACVFTITIICVSYGQIIELFPSGGGGYLVASKLISPTAGVVSGSALLIDYVLTITISIASGADALFSVLPAEFHSWKLMFSCCGIAFLTVLNLRGVKESVMLWVPIFFVFVATHAIAIFGSLFFHTGDLSVIASHTVSEVKQAGSELGLIGLIALLLKAFSMGAGTYTGIEAVSNGLSILREPRVETGKRTMLYLGASLGITVFGLLLAYLIYNVQPVEGKTLNTVLFEKITAHWPGQTGVWFTSISMLSATLLLFIAAQAGFLDGPRVLSNMALDRWFPSRFSALSDRFVAQNGIFLMGGCALAVLLLSHGSVQLLIVLYSINVFITFSLSQIGMVRHWWKVRNSEVKWKQKLTINGIGLLLTSFILISLCVVKFWEGGWITLLITGALVLLAFAIKRHYQTSFAELRQLDDLVKLAELPVSTQKSQGLGRTAIVLVNGFNGLGLHTFWGIFKLFPDTFGHFIFVQIGVVDAGSFKGAEELSRLKQQTVEGAARYVALAQQNGFKAEAVTDVSHEMIRKIEEITEDLFKKHPHAVIFSGQLAFLKETFWTRLLHNHAVFALQRFFCAKAMPFVIVPARVP